MRPGIKYQTIYKNRYEYGVSALCKFFDVSRSGYYAWLKRKDAQDRDLHLCGLIRECQQKTKQTYGYRRVRLWLLRKKHMSVNGKAVLRVMRKYGLLSEIRRPRPYQKGITRFKTYENHLQQDFKTASPGVKWVTDISYIHTGQGTLYLSIVKDLYDNSIVAYDMGTQQDNGLVCRTVEKAMKKKRRGLILHSDQGGQYASKDYYDLLKKYGFTPSMSRKANPLDNSPAENFFSIIKSECTSRYTFKTIDYAKKLIREYIWFYNHERIQSVFGCSPLEKRTLSA